MADVSRHFFLPPTSPIFFERQRNNAIGMTEMGIAPTTVSAQIPAHSIGQRYEAQSQLSCYGRFRADL